MDGVIFLYSLFTAYFIIKSSVFFSHSLSTDIMFFSEETVITSVNKLVFVSEMVC